MFVLLLLGLASAQIVPPETLAPGPDALDRAVTRLEEQLDRADGIERELAHLHNELAEHMRRSKLDCADTDRLRGLARSGPLGEQLRQVIQAARVQRVRVDELVAAPTIAPLATEILAVRLTDLRTRTTTRERAVLELSAWHKRWVEPAERRCAAALKALATPGPPTPAEPAPSPPPPAVPAP